MLPISCVEVIQSPVESSIPSLVAYFSRFGEDSGDKHHLRCSRCGWGVGCECVGAIRLSPQAVSDPYMMSDMISESPEKKIKIDSGRGVGPLAAVDMEVADDLEDTQLDSEEDSLFGDNELKYKPEELKVPDGNATDFEKLLFHIKNESQQQKKFTSQSLCAAFKKKKAQDKKKENAIKASVTEVQDSIKTLKESITTVQNNQRQFEENLDLKISERFKDWRPNNPYSNSLNP